MDNVCNRRLFSFPAKVEMAEEQEYLKSTLFWGKGAEKVSKTQEIEFYCQVSQHFCHSLSETVNLFLVQ